MSIPTLPIGKQTFSMWSVFSFDRDDQKHLFGYENFSGNLHNDKSGTFQSIKVADGERFSKVTHTKSASA